MVTRPAARPSAQLTFRELSSPEDLTEAAQLIADVFGAEDGPPMAVDLLAAIVCSGGFVGGAYLDDTLVGTAAAFGEVAAPGHEGPVGLHSHVAAVAMAARGLRVGQRLKWYQRDWALERGIEVIHWTFDPLVRRNATLNLNRLGGLAVRYDENLYGAIPDALNHGQESDRLLLRWELTSQRVIKASTAALGIDDGPVGGWRATISTPPDVETLLVSDPDAARAWRARQREAFRALEPGWVVTGIDADGDYVVREDGSDADVPFEGRDDQQ